MIFFRKTYFALFCLDQEKLLQFVDGSEMDKKFSILTTVSLVQWLALWHLDLRLQIRILSLLWTLFNILSKNLKFTISQNIKSGQSRGMGSSLTAARVMCNMQVNLHCALQFKQCVFSKSFNPISFLKLFWPTVKNN